MTPAATGALPGSIDPNPFGQAVFWHRRARAPAEKVGSSRKAKARPDGGYGGRTSNATDLHRTPPGRQNSVAATECYMASGATVSGAHGGRHSSEGSKISGCPEGGLAIRESGPSPRQTRPGGIAQAPGQPNVPYFQRWSGASARDCKARVAPSTAADQPADFDDRFVDPVAKGHAQLGAAGEPGWRGITSPARGLPASRPERPERDQPVACAVSAPDAPRASNMCRLSTTPPGVSRTC